MREVVPRLESGRKIERAYLGVQTRESTTGAGAVRRRGSRRARRRRRAASRSATRSSRVGGKPVTTPEDISIAIESRKPGEQIEIQVQRAGARKTLQRDARHAAGDSPDPAASPRTRASPSR